MIAVLDLGTGNLHSVQKAVERVAPRARVVVTNDPETVRRAERLIFPGQGAIGSCMAALGRNGLREAVLETLEARPYLGICLGLQVLFASSEEDAGTPGLKLLAGRVCAFAAAAAQGRMDDPATARALKIPHMGWNTVRQSRPHPLWAGIAQDARFYFVHSYYARSDEAAEVAGTTEYGIDFTSAAARDNIFAVQFHPEKSQRAGLRLLENFVKWDGAGP